MPLYMTQFSYTSEAWAALARNPEDRSAVLTELIENLGGRMVSFYYSFGEYDGVFIYEAPDESTPAAAILSAISPGHVKTTKTTLLLTVEDAVEVLRRAGAMTYRGPGETPGVAPPEGELLPGTPLQVPPEGVPREGPLDTPVTPPEDAVPPDVPSPPGEERPPRSAP
jgi:uncharacterized protein with GYD domain